MPQFGRGIAYSPFFAEAMGDVVSGLEDRRERELNEQKGQLASEAWMGDPESMQRLAALDPAMAAKVEGVNAQRDKAKRQTALDTAAARKVQVDESESFQGALEDVITGVASFDTFEEAKGFADPRLARLRQLYPEQGLDELIGDEFTEQDFNEAKQIASSLGDVKPVGTAGYWTDNEGKMYRGLVMSNGSELIVDPNTNRPMTDQRRRELGVQATGALDAAQAGRIAFSKQEGATTAKINLADDLAIAELSAKALTEIAPARLKSQVALDLVDKVRNHPGLSSAVGIGFANPTKFLAGTEANDFRLMAERLEGEVFSQAYQTLKGGGPITDYEGRKAAAALAQMKASQSEEQFHGALDDFERAIHNGFNVLVQQAKTGTVEEVDLSPLDTPGGNVAPPGALAQLAENPGTIDQFEATFGYRPEGY